MIKYNNYIWANINIFKKIVQKYIKEIKLKIIAETEDGKISVKEIELDFKKENENSRKLIDPDTNFEPLNVQLAKEQANFDNYGDKLLRSL